MISTVGRSLLVSILGLLVAVMAVFGQERHPVATPAVDRLASHEKLLERRAESPFARVPFEPIGPTIMSGRVADIDVRPDDPTHFYVAYASGGLWKTTSNGTRFEPVFEDQASMTIGDIAVRWTDEEVVYVGTGENNSSRSSYSGTGVYKSEDGGQTWAHLGLAETHHIGRIVLHPDDPETIWVGAIGHLYSSNPERGVFKSEDGGETWRQTLFIDDTTGVIDIVIDPVDPARLYASTWHRQRRAWNLDESGRTSGIYASSDGGETWSKISTPRSGFPTGRGVGRIGLAIAASDPSVIYATVDNQQVREEADEDAPALTFAKLKEMDAAAFSERVSDEQLEAYLDYHSFPDELNADSVRTAIQLGNAYPADLVLYVSDANRALFEKPVTGCEVYRSNDRGKTWWKTHDEYLDDTCYTFGYYFGQIRVSPHNSDEVYVAGVPLLKSVDGGETWENIGRENVHVDHHALWLNPRRYGHLVNGNDGGINISYDGGESWLKLNSPKVGQFYTVSVDLQDPYYVYGGLQDNGIWKGPSTYTYSTKWQGEGRYPYQRLLGGDGMMIEIDPRDPDRVYVGYQFGYYFRSDLATDSRESIRPQHRLGEKPYRFNWLTPIHLSRHNPDILYFGSQMVHRSMDRGDTWSAISGDLTQGGIEGDVPFGTLTALAESEMQFGLLYAGADDGLMHVSKDGGATWTRIGESLPEHLWVSRIEPSRFELGRVYVSLNGYRWDHMDPYVYVSQDFGSTWTQLGSDLPLGPVNVVREDMRDPQILWVGTDHGVFVSSDGGVSFHPIGSELTMAPVHDLRVHPREHELVVATHGRSIFKADVSHIQRLNRLEWEAFYHVFEPDTVAYSENWGDRPSRWKNPPTPDLALVIHSQQEASGGLWVLNQFDHTMAELDLELTEGLNYVELKLETTADALERHAEAVQAEPTTQPLDSEWLEERDNGKVYLPPGSYEIKLKLNGTVNRVPLVLDKSPD